MNNPMSGTWRVFVHLCVCVYLCTNYVYVFVSDGKRLTSVWSAKAKCRAPDLFTRFVFGSKFLA